MTDQSTDRPTDQKGKVKSCVSTTKNRIVICYKQKEINTNVLLNKLLVEEKRGSRGGKAKGKR